MNHEQNITWLLEIEECGTFCKYWEFCSQRVAVRCADMLTKLGNNCRVLKIVDGIRPV